MSGGAEPTPKTAIRGGAAGEVLAAFLRLGLTSFGGPIAHLGYFHDEFVVRRRWLDEKTYVDLVALSQFLPGPASTKVGIAIGVNTAGGVHSALRQATSGGCSREDVEHVALLAITTLGWPRAMAAMSWVLDGFDEEDEPAED